MHITDLFIRTVEPKEKPQTYWDSNLRGFGIRVNPGGSKTFIVLVASGRRKSIGRYPLLKLADAREEAKKILAAKMLGKINPNNVPYYEAKEAFLLACEQKNKPSTVTGYRQGLNAHFKFGKKSVADITEFQVRQVLNGLNTKPSTKHHAFTIFRIFLNWCMAEGLLDHSPMERMKPPPVPKSRDRVLTDSELTTLWAYLKGRIWIDEADTFDFIVALLLLTGQRRNEIANLKWEWIDEEYITIPWTITKNHRPSIVPITSLTETVLAHVPHVDDEPFLFPASRKMSKNTTVFNGWGKAKKEFDVRVGFTGWSNHTGWTLHDLRRTIASKLAELGVSQIVVEKLLNHVSGGSQSQIAQVYNRYEYLPEKKEALLKWQRFLDRLLDA